MLKTHFSKNIVHKVLIYFIFANILPIIILSCLFFNKFNSILKNEIFNLTYELADRKEQCMELVFDQVENLINNVSSTEELQNILYVGNRHSNVVPASYKNAESLEKINHILDNNAALKGMVSIDIYSLQNTRYHLGPKLNTESADMDYRLLLNQAEKSGKPVFWYGVLSGTSMGPDNHKVIAAVKVLKNNKKNLGLLVANCSAEIFYNKLYDFNYDEKVYGTSNMVLDSRNNIVYFIDRNEIGKKPDGSLLALLKDNDGKAEKLIRGHKTIFIYNKSEYNDWTFLSFSPVKGILSQTSPVRNYLIICIVLCLAIVMLSGFIILKKEISRIKNISNSLIELKDGNIDLKKRLADNSEDEIGQLSKLFNMYLNTLEERNKIEANYKNSEIQNMNFIYNLNEVVYQIDNKGILEFLNPSWSDLTGYSLEESIGENIARFILEGDKVQYHKRFQKLLHGQIPYLKYSIRLIKKDGDILWIEGVSQYIKNFRGNFMHVMGSFHDVTKHKLIESELIKAKETAEDICRSKGEFLANVSHEIRTPMNSIIGITELLLDTPHDSCQKELLITVDNAGRLLLNIINDLLDFSKIEANKFMLNPKEFILADVIEKAGEILSINSRENGLSLMTFISPEIPGLTGDPERLSQVILNLGGNAVKFTGRGEVEIRAFMEKQEEDLITILFEVHDTGPGVPEEAINKIFEPFVQAGGTQSHKFAGTGLGLAISKSIVELMHGSIGVRSKEGCGSVFWFTTQFRQASLSYKAVTEKDLLSGLRMLIIDGSSLNSKILSYYADAWGIKNDRITRFEEAFEILVREAGNNTPYNLAVFNGISYPVDELLKFSDKIKSDSTVSATSLIYISGYGKSSRDIEALKSGFSAVLLKPFRQSQLFECIAELTGRVHKLSSTVSAPSPTGSGSIYVSNPAGGEVPAISSLSSGERPVLLAEDITSNRMLAVAQLARLGLAVNPVSSGKEAVKEYLNNYNNYSLILMDCQMPEMDGYEATKAIRKAEKEIGNHIPIVAMTANAMEGDEEKCISSGMDDYISKPITLEKLRITVKKWLKSNMKP